MNILVTGASGLIGRALVPHLEKSGHTVIAAVRRAPRSTPDARSSPASAPKDGSAGGRKRPPVVQVNDKKNETSARWGRAHVLMC